MFLNCSTSMAGLGKKAPGLRIENGNGDGDEECCWNEECVRKGWRPVLVYMHLGHTRPTESVVSNSTCLVHATAAKSHRPVSLQLRNRK